MTVTPGRALDGLRLAVTTLTVLPLRAGRVDRPTAAVAMGLAPLVGAVLGLTLAGLHGGLRTLGAPALVAAGVAVAAGALLTRGLHLDGLADTVDALGSYRSGPGALEIMKKPDIGPFGVVALAATVLIQAAALAAVPWWSLVIAWTTGRLAITVACRRGVPPARPEGLGAMVASTVSIPALLPAAVAVAAAAIPAVPGRPWQGPVAVLLALAAVLVLLRHCVRRLGGITGDVLGACVELATTVTLVTLTLR
ncbi:adenosylcobinamide-GDP ribazoletransferase [Actinoplanes teichomyceticus]|uniref:Adenosylcobinamide-GDP ribazoletransferase n=1 Tax=Actinoplanes teichomyceticus TaxID=1867 RepID=A0A561WIR4_ACTTI|nr:adenosylcobinamide-GDP ribazoletransferase [Actinoplanes teichomyceticus]TWG23734.1 cobalamin-5'-phosphate synthase [Actinoplanes teichomyceticus]GIF11775.1 adenosylcobinamide-GDP ribazoletransferase [Actinoplanes teichomyceticus]